MSGDWNRDPHTGAVRVPPNLPAVTTAPCYALCGRRAAVIYTAWRGRTVEAERGACHTHRAAALRWAQARGEVTEHVLDEAPRDGQGTLFDDSG